MIIRFWGVRGSSPTPLSPEEVSNKIIAALQRARPSDLISTDSRKRFISHLPRDIISTVGGNTACVEVSTAGSSVIILDTGTGLREFEKRVRKNRRKISEYHIFLSHFHYDHLLGLPYFGAMYTPGIKVNFYSPYPAMERILADFLRKPYHPVGWDSFAADITFTVIGRNQKINIGNTEIDWIKRKHPNGSISYKITEAGKSFIYSTDTELTEKDFKRTPRNIEYFAGADAIVLDAQYTLGEAIEKYNWGHSSYSLAVEFAREFEIERLFLFHHEPLNTDTQTEKILRSAQWFENRLDHMDKKQIEVELAREGFSFEL